VGTFRPKRIKELGLNTTITSYKIPDVSAEVQEVKSEGYMRINEV